MVANRQDAWTEDDDLLLAEVSLKHIREGSTQLLAFEEVGQKLNRTSAACGFRWNSLVRRKYEAAIQIAKAQRQQRSYQRKPKFPNKEVEHEVVSHEDTYCDNEDDVITYDGIIKFLKKQKSSSTTLHKNSKKYEKFVEEKNKEIEFLKKENSELKEKVKYIETDYRTVNEDYKSLIQIMDRARKLAFLESSEDDDKPVFKMDSNGNLERLNK